MEKTRYKFLDYSKGIGILMIVLAHSVQYFQPMELVKRYACGFHVPIFFVVAGCIAWLQRDKQIQFSLYVKKRFSTLLVPYIFFSLFNSALKFAVLIIGNKITADVIRDELIALFITGNGTVWFLVTLFFTEIVFRVIYGIFGNKSIIVLSIITFMAPYCLSDYLQFPVGTVLIRIIAAIAYYCLGYLLCEFFVASKVKTVGLISTIALVIGSITVFALKQRCNFFGGTFDYIVPSILNTTLLSFGYIGIMSVAEMRQSKLAIFNCLEYIGKNSLIIMLIHPTLLLVATYPLGGCFWEMKGCLAIITSLLLFSCVLFACIPFIFIINRYFSWIIGKKRSIR